MGVDIEKIDGSRHLDAIAKRYFSDSERDFMQKSPHPTEAFFELWAQKEAFIKAKGSTLFQTLEESEVPLSGNLKVPRVGKMGWWFQTLELSPDYAAAVVSDCAFDEIKQYDFGAVQWEN